MLRACGSCPESGAAILGHRQFPIGYKVRTIVTFDLASGSAVNHNRRYGYRAEDSCGDTRFVPSEAKIDADAK
jgi:hypothetical protein